MFQKQGLFQICNCKYLHKGGGDDDYDNNNNNNNNGAY